MGDRANVVVKDGDSQVWFYGHWMGDSYIEDARRALARRARWDDGPYLARIVFDALTDGRHGEESGLGIFTSLTDNEHPILVLDVQDQRVSLLPETTLVDGKVPQDYRLTTTRQTFEEFVAEGLSDAP